MAADDRDDSVVQWVFRIWSWTYDASPLQPFFYRPIQRRVARHLAGTPAESGRILDVGCGTGQLIEELHRRFPGADVFGLDASHPMLAAGRRRRGVARLPLVCGDAAALPVASHSIDAIVSTIAYQWLRDPQLALAEFRRVLRPDGRLVIATLASLLLDVRFLGQRFATVATHRADLAAAGFDLESVEWWGTHVRVFVARPATLPV